MAYNKQSRLFSRNSLTVNVITVFVIVVDLDVVLRAVVVVNVAIGTVAVVSVFVDAECATVVVNIRSFIVEGPGVVVCSFIGPVVVVFVISTSVGTGQISKYSFCGILSLQYPGVHMSSFKSL